MRVIGLVALCVVLTACATTGSLSVQDCGREASYARGARDAEEGHALDLSFAHGCSPAIRTDAMAAYRDGFAAGSSSRSASSGAPSLASVAVPSAPVLREPASPTWVCEVESNSKVFTGIGATREEAAGSARTTCGSHFQASYCNKVDCKQNL